MGDNKNSGPAGGVRGVVEDVRGKAKEPAGAVTLRAQRDAARKAAEADSARAGAKAAEKREQSHE